MLARPFPHWFDIGALCVALMIVVQFWGETRIEGPLPVPIAAPAAHVAIYGAAPTEGVAAAAWADWLDDPTYFGAFAVARDGSTFGMTAKYNDAALARADALAGCEAEGSLCRMVAVSRAAGRMPVEGVVLQAETLTAFGDYLGLDGARAFAVSDRGAAGWAWGHVFETGATAAALAACTAQNTPMNTQLAPAPCYVVDSRHAIAALRDLLR